MMKKLKKIKTINGINKKMNENNDIIVKNIDENRRRREDK